MKGFIKIIEAIIASLILLIALTFFFTPSLRQSSWDNTLLESNSLDAMAAVYRSGELSDYVQNNRKSDFNLKMFTLLPRSVDFTAEISGIPKPEIRIACVCSNDDFSAFDRNIKPLGFLYKNRLIFLILDRVDSINDVGDDADVILYLNHDKLQNKNGIIQFLEKGKGVVAVFDVNEPQINDGIMNDIFGLSWNNKQADSDTGVVVNNNDPKSMPFFVSKYYNNITNGGTLRHSISNSVSIDEKTLMTDSSNKISFSKANTIYNGRTAWYSNSDDNEEYIFLKAIFMWVSGERFVFSDNKKIPENSRTMYFLTFNNDPYELILHVWRIFR